MLSAVDEVKQDDDRDHKRQNWGERKLKAGWEEGSLRNDNLAEIKDVQEAWRTKTQVSSRASNAQLTWPS